MAIVDGQKIIIEVQDLVFGYENVGKELPASPFASYASGSGSASGWTEVIGQIVAERDIQPVNACSGALGTGLGSKGVKNTSYIG